MKTLAELRKAVANGDSRRARTLLDSLATTPTNLQEVSEIKDLLTWALQMTRIQRAHYLAELQSMARTIPYQTERSASRSTWSFNA